MPQPKESELKILRQPSTNFGGFTLLTKHHESFNSVKVEDQSSFYSSNVGSRNYRIYNYTTDSTQMQLGAVAADVQ